MYYTDKDIKCITNYKEFKFKKVLQTDLENYMFVLKNKDAETH